MATLSSIHILFFALITSGVAVSATEFIFKNNCPYTIWVGSFVRGGNKPGRGGFQLSRGTTVGQTANVLPGWNSRFWPRTGCNFDSSYNRNCITGNCGGGVSCTTTAASPVTLVEFTLQGDGGKDYYNISTVDGFNVRLSIQPEGGSGDCRSIECVSHINVICPNKLKVKNKGKVVGCKSACAAFKKEEYCCTGSHNKRETCPPTNYSRLFKNACPSAYSYAYDDRSRTFTCSGANYLITFCP